MIVRQFLQWLRHASPGERAEATSALARAYLHSDLSPADLSAAEGAMIMLLDDPSPLVRGALAQVFASAQKAPPVVVHALAADQPDVAIPVLSRSPLLSDEDLVDLFATAQPDAQVAIASRAMLTSPLAAAIAEVGCAQACLTLLENPDASIAVFSVDRIVERFGHLSAIRESLMDRDDLPMATRQALLAKLSQTLAGFVTARHWLGSEHAEYAAREACEKATVALAADTPYEEISELMRHLRQSGQLTAGMVLRALLSGNVVLFEEALAELTGMPIERVSAYIQDKHISGFRAIYAKAGLPDTAYPAFREAIAALRDGILLGETGGVSHLKRRMVERVLDACAAERRDDMASLLALLRRFAVEAAREEARMFCDDLVANDQVAFMPHIDEPRLVA
ncbi:hypothetical protein ASD45_05845 [Pseudolabrys sp. Root1462]|uniref:DUF2336 domain-containing protein n=1 Tax=Pseudolabrys sp. Root1462 TaxID=1736466 RepID=UPI0007038BA1|nr:DUF2336 domain-containing protein [Pseudolabrys sp. Root1462]KQZ00430.1 hypothetical protein ASD45_05845 [Pseudolabrys sp. Root1462]